MACSAPPSPPTLAEVRRDLDVVARLLREKEPLMSAEASALVAELVQEFGHALAVALEASWETPPPPHASPDDYVNALPATLEARVPVVAGLTRRLIDALSGLGI